MTKALTIGVAAFGVAGLLALPADAQNRGRTADQPTVRRAVPRDRVQGVRPGVRVAPNRYRGVRPYYSRPYYYGYYPYGYPSALAFSYGYGYGWGPYGYPSPRYVVPVGSVYGSVRIDIEQRDAEVFVDGFYVGIVDDFDGVFQKINLEPASHRIEIRAPGFEPTQFEVNVLPGHTITYRTPLQPQP